MLMMEYEKCPLILNINTLFIHFLFIFFFFLFSPNDIRLKIIDVTFLLDIFNNKFEYEIFIINYSIENWSFIFNYLQNFIVFINISTHSIMARKSSETSTNVRAVPTAEDQQQINQFARLHKSFLEFTEKLAILNNQNLNLEEAADEVMLLDDEFAGSIPLQIGSVFVHYDQETIGQKLEERKENTQRQIEEMKEKIAGIEAEMNKLRTILYAKFGDNIQLEDENGEGEIVGV